MLVTVEECTLFVNIESVEVRLFTTTLINIKLWLISCDVFAPNYEDCN